MIKANELRIGNLIRSNPNGGFGEIIELHTIDKHTVYGHSLDGQLKNLRIDLDRWNDPIPLTPEILEGCGFVEIDAVNSDGDDILGWKIKKPNGEFLFIDENLQPVDYSFPIVDYKIEYLHQLQNLYFALTGTELEVNLKEKALSGN